MTKVFVMSSGSFLEWQMAQGAAIRTGSENTRCQVHALTQRQNVFRSDPGLDEVQVLVRNPKGGRGTDAVVRQRQTPEDWLSPGSD